VTYVSLSLWVFDIFYYWTPLVSPLVQMVLTFLLISNYKFVLNEKTRWSLEKESLVMNQLEEMKTNFLSLFSHDLKTPLAKILGIVDTLKSQVDDPLILTELDKIDQSSKELDKYIKKILKLSQIQSKNISLNIEPTDINQLIDSAVEQNIHLAQKKGIKIEKQQTPLFMLDVDGALIKEVIINFIENAISYSPEGGEISVSSDETESFIKVAIKDQGPGIPKQFHESIWEKSIRFDKEKTGYGLGLFLSRYVIELHGGQVFLNSRENSGSEFGFLLPLSEEDKSETS
jgi:K+-sensing histidine kinase KdpD